MLRSPFSKDQIIGILKEHQAGTPLAKLCRGQGIRDIAALILFDGRSRV